MYCIILIIWQLFIVHNKQIRATTKRNVHAIPIKLHTFLMLGQYSTHKQKLYPQSFEEVIQKLVLLFEYYECLGSTIFAAIWFCEFSHLSSDPYQIMRSLFNMIQTFIFYLLANVTTTIAFEQFRITSEYWVQNIRVWNSLHSHSLLSYTLDNFSEAKHNMIRTNRHRDK